MREADEIVAQAIAMVGESAIARREAALRARLTALVAEMRDAIWKGPDGDLSGWNRATHEWADRLAALLREPPEATPSAGYQTVATLSVDATCATQGCQLARAAAPEAPR